MTIPANALLFRSECYAIVSMPSPSIPPRPPFDPVGVLTQNLMRLVAAIHLCAGHQLVTPTLILLYCGIDIAGWLATRQETTPVARRFIEWTSKYLLPGSPLKCRAVELYGARCGLVHTLTADSDLSAGGKARKIIYASGVSKVDTLQELTAFSKLEHTYVAVQLEDLIGAFAKGLEKFLGELEHNPKRAERAFVRAELLFTDMSNDYAEGCLQAVRDVLGPDIYRRRS